MEQLGKNEFNLMCNYRESTKKVLLFMENKKNVIGKIFDFSSGDLLQLES